MTPEEIRLINAVHDAERLIGQIYRLVADTDEMLDTALAAHKRGRTEVVRERLERSLYNLRDIKLRIDDYNAE